MASLLVVVLADCEEQQGRNDEDLEQQDDNSGEMSMMSTYLILVKSEPWTSFAWIVSSTVA